MDGWQILALLLTDYTVRTVALGATVLGVVSGVLSCYAVLRRQSLLGDAMSHAALPGVVLAFILTGSKAMPVLMTGALIAGWVGVLFVLVVTNQTRIKEDSALGIVLAVFFGLGLMLLTWLQRHGPASQSGLDKFLFGKAAALVMEDVVVMAAVGIVGLITVGLLWKELKLLSFDRAYAATLGYPVGLLDVLLTTLIVLAVVVGLQTVGVVLMSAMIVAPGAAARQWTDRLNVMVVLAALFGTLAGVGGALISSLATDIPTGPTIVLLASLVVAVSLALAPARGLVWRRLRQRRHQRTYRRRAALLALYAMGARHGDPTRPHPGASVRVALGDGGAVQALEKLAEEGLVTRADGDQWALTPQGVARAEVLLRAEAGAGFEEEANHAPGG